MKIFDTRWHGAHGIGRFSRELSVRLPDFKPINMAGRPASAVEPLRLERYLRATKAEFFLSPGYNAPLTRRTPFAFCLHDLNHLAGDERRGYRKKKYYEWFVRPSVTRAEIVFTVSEYSKAEICGWANIAPDRVANVGNGISQKFCLCGGVFRFGRYFLHVGGERPHKNLNGVMKALASSDTLRDVNLVCVGGDRKSVMRAAADSGIIKRIVSFHNVSDEQLAEIYRGAIGLVFVSLREGFGLPIVEAMACGCPVITSSVSSMPEISGGAALLVDPSDVDDIREKMEAIAFDVVLRECLVEKGKVRALEFSWDATAQRVIAELEKLGL